MCKAEDQTKRAARQLLWHLHRVSWSVTLSNSFWSFRKRWSRNGSRAPFAEKAILRNHVILNHIESSNGIGFSIGFSIGSVFRLSNPHCDSHPHPTWRLCCCSCMCRGPPMNGDPRCVCCCIDLCGILAVELSHARIEHIPGSVVGELSLFFVWFVVDVFFLHKQL